jgi:cyclopropane fatty-acyl-phospholipid synthase-like methyltransferase
VLRDGGRVLDAGCGGGWAVVQIADRFPETHCIGIDLEPYSVELARRLIAERGLADRCEARALSVDQLGEDGEYDVATSFLVVHEINPALKPAAFAAVARALRPGGRFLIFDEAYPETDEALRQMPTRFAALAQWYVVSPQKDGPFELLGFHYTKVDFRRRDDGKHTEALFSSSRTPLC